MDLFAIDIQEVPRLIDPVSLHLSLLHS